MHLLVWDSLKEVTHLISTLQYMTTSSMYPWYISDLILSRHVQMKKDNALAAANLQNQPKVDYSLKSGQTIHVELKVCTKLQVIIDTPKGRTGAAPAPKRSDGGSLGGGTYTFDVI